jgi:hypothetical protein
LDGSSPAASQSSTIQTITSEKQRTTERHTTQKFDTRYQYTHGNDTSEH